jgi:N-carbamoylputrescine amidase
MSPSTPRSLRIALVQNAASDDPAANLARGLAAAREAAAAGSRLVAFPELAFSRFHPRCPAAGGLPLELAEPIPGPTTDAFCALARELGVVVVLNVYERDGKAAYDSSPVIDADGSLLGVTRMLHITDYEHYHEQGYYLPGDRGLPVYDTAVGRIAVVICYDRHYPEVMRRPGLSRADLVVVPQAGALGEWPEGLFEAEMRVAAFQNGYFVALVNRVGAEGDLEFAGESFVSDPAGVVVARAPTRREHVLLADLDLGAVARSCARTLFLRHRRPDLAAALCGGADEST